MTARREIVVPSVGVILADPRGNWSSLWRRQLTGSEIPVRSAETLTAVADLRTVRPWDLVAVVLDTFRAEAVWAWWQADREGRPVDRVCLLGGRECDDVGWALLEAGCRVWIRKPQDIRLAVGVARRHCATVSLEHLPLEDRLQYALPWPSAVIPRS